MWYIVHYRGYGVRGRSLERSIRGGGGGAKSARRRTRTTTRPRNRVAETYCCYYIRTFSPPSDKFMTCHTYIIRYTGNIIILLLCKDSRICGSRYTSLCARVSSPRYVYTFYVQVPDDDDDITIQYSYYSAQWTYRYNNVY